MFALLALGYSINLLTLLALVLAIGLVVDDAIVVVENIHRHIEEGMHALRRGDHGRARDRACRSSSMTITLAAVYAPIGFVSGADRRAVPRVRLHARRRRHRLRHHRADAVADDGSKLLKRASTAAGASSACSTASSQPAAALRAPAAPHARPPRRPRSWCSSRVMAATGHHVHHHAARARSRGGPGHPVQYRQDARSRPTSTTWNRRPPSSARCSRPCPRRSTSSPSTACGDVHQAFVGILFKPWEERTRSRSRSWPSLQGQVSQHAHAQVFTLPAAVAAGLDRRPAGAIRDHDHGRLYASWRRCSRRSRQKRAEERHVHLHRQRPQVRDAADRTEDRPRQGQPPRHQHAGHRRLAGDVARRQLRQPVQPLRPQLPGDPAGAARVPAHARLAQALPGAHQHRRRWCRCRAWSRSSSRCSPTR